MTEKNTSNNTRARARKTVKKETFKPTGSKNNSPPKNLVKSKRGNLDDNNNNENDKPITPDKEDIFDANTILSFDNKNVPTRRNQKYTKQSQPENHNET